MPNQQIGLTPMLWEDAGYTFSTDGDQNDVIDFNLGTGEGIEVLAISHIQGVQSYPDDTIMAVGVSVTLDLGATAIPAISGTMFEDNNAIWQDLTTYVQQFVTTGSSTAGGQTSKPDWKPAMPLIIAQNLNVVVSMRETLSGVMFGNVRIYFRKVRLTDTDLIRLLARGRFR